jgi:hypothetical protein
MAASFLRPSTFGTPDHQYLKKRFSNHSWPVKLAAQWLLDLREMRKIEQFILHGDDETVMAFKSSQISAVGMTAVAVGPNVVVIFLMSMSSPWKSKTGDDVPADAPLLYD